TRGTSSIPNSSNQRINLCSFLLSITVPPLFNPIIEVVIFKGFDFERNEKSKLLKSLGFYKLLVG
ncbi:MAG: hypothetical protein QF632_05110, partial [Candidatus Woesearchaeota archaeon]|nr:hypothetical protein [Candidatus Woesearchaeota archaeon]